MDYEDQVLHPKIYNAQVGKSYVTIGLFGELSEWLEKVFAEVDEDADLGDRDELDQKRNEEIYKELGDVLWYLAGIRNEFQLELSGGRSIKDATMGSFVDSVRKSIPAEITEDTIPELSFKFFIDLVISCGKISEYHKKEIRDGSVKTEQIAKEWEKSMANLDACLILAHGSSLEELANANLQKLISRQERGTLGGEGDNR